jgi:hypothetical protein
VTVTYGNPEGYNPILIAALYDSAGRLLDIIMDDSLPAWGANQYTFKFNTAGAFIKVFLWDAITYAPILDSVSPARIYPNVALSKNTDCNTYNNEDQKCSQLVNGVLSNKWCTQYNVGDAGYPSLWAVVDLGGNYKVNKWVVQHAQAGGESSSYNTRDFSIQVSLDGVNFFVLESITGNTASSTSRNVDIVFRYIKLNVTNAVQSGGGRNACRIPAIEVYGEPYSGANPDYSALGLNLGGAHTPRHMGSPCAK